MKRLSVVVLFVLASCSGDRDPGISSMATTSGVVTTGSEEGCADVVDATITVQGSTFVIAATVSSADTGWDKYADAWQVWDETGDVIAERVLTHPHETEQPFTRSLSGIVIPDDVAKVTIAARDSVEGFCGDVLEREVPGR